MGILLTLVLPSSSSPFREVASVLGSYKVTVKFNFLLTSTLDKTIESDKVHKDLAGFCIIILVFSLFSISRYMIGCIISKAKIQE